MSSYTQQYLIPLAQSFLYLVCENRNWEDGFKNIHKNYNIDIDALKKEKAQEIDLLTRMVNDFAGRQADNMPQIRAYFGSPDPEGKIENMSLLVQLLDTYELLSIRNENELRNRLLSFNQDKYMELFSSALCSYNNIYLKNDSSLASVSTLEIMRFIMESSFSDAIKCQLQDLYLNRKNHVDKFCKIMGLAASHLLEYEDELNQILEHFYDYWQRVQGNRSLHEFISQEINLLSQIEECPWGYELIPSLYPFTFSLSSPSEDETEPHKSVLSLGLMYGDSFTLSRAFATDTMVQNADTVIEAVKLISDRTRFEILRYISGQKAYGNEIAEHLNLTTATVSHHMGQLVSCNLANIERKGGKMYYSLNKEALSTYLAFYEDQLLDS